MKEPEVKMSKPTLYYAHPVNSFGHAIEAKIEDIIQANFKDCKILNPNQPVHQRNYQHWKKELGDGMEYYFQCVLPSCDVAVGLTFPEGTHGKGVAGELEWFFRNGKPIYEITPSGVITPLKELPIERFLNLDDTRDRVYNYDYEGNSK